MSSILTPELASAIVELIDTRYKELRGPRSQDFEEHYGAVFSIDDVGKYSVALFGGQVERGFSAPSWMSVAVGDAVRTRSQGADRYIDTNFTQPIVSGGSGGGSAFPIGAIFISVDPTNPATTLGYGTWTAFGTGRVLVGVDVAEPLWDTVEETGGAKTVAATGSNATEATHTHTGPSHTHTAAAHAHATPFGVSGTTLIRRLSNAIFGSRAGTDPTVAQASSVADSTANLTLLLTSSDTPADSGASGTGASGAGASHGHAFTGTASSVLQPFIAVWMWKRTA